MPISTTHYRKCKHCGKIFPVVIGDCLDGHELIELLHPICNECKGKEMKAKLKKLLKGGSQ